MYLYYTIQKSWPLLLQKCRLHSTVVLKILGVPEHLVVSVLSMGEETPQSLAMKVVATLAKNLYVGSSAYISFTEVPAR